MCLALGSGDEESVLEGHVVQKNQAWIAQAEDIERAGFDWKQVESVPIVDLSLLGVHPGGDVPPPVEASVRVGGTDLNSELCSWKEQQTERDGGGVGDRSCLCQSPPENVRAVHVSGFARQIRGNLRPDGPVIMLVGMGHRAEGDRAAHPHVIELRLMSLNAALDVPQSFSIGQLNEGLGHVLVYEGLDVPFAVIMLHATSEILVGNELHHLSEDHTTSIHSPRPFHKEDIPSRNPHRFPSKTMIVEGRYTICRPLQKLS